MEPEGQQKLFKWTLEKQKWFFFYIVRYQDNIIGTIEVKVVNHMLPLYEIGISVNPEFRNIGHGENMINFTVDYLKNTMLAKRIQAFVNVDNKPSNALFRKTILSKECTLKSYGVTPEGDPVDANIYSVIF